MKSIKPFIDLGWYTVPLKGELRRLDDGNKTIPVFEEGWKENYQKEFNERETFIGGVLTGFISDILAIDCDNGATYELFSSLDTLNTFHFVSDGKSEHCGTIIYKYDRDLDKSFSISNDTMKMDFYSDNGFIYLPTDLNTSKVSWGERELPKLSPVPDTIKLVLQQLRELANKPKVNDNREGVLPTSTNYLAPQIKIFVDRKTFIPGLFRIITPRDFRDLDCYVKNGYVHPKDIPEGRGSEYLSKVSAIFGADPSIDKDLYSYAIRLINDMWESPIKSEKLDATIVNPMVNGRSAINGTSIWRYDEFWEKRGLIMTTKRGNVIELFFDDKRAIYYCVDLVDSEVRSFDADAKMHSFVEAITPSVAPKAELKKKLPLIYVSSQPSKTFGFYQQDEYTRCFNQFRQSTALAILGSPETYKEQYKRPNNILNYFETLIPDMVMRNYVLKFLRRKFTTFEYSPVILYFLGKSGSGKDTFVTLLELILGADYISKPSADEFLDKYNEWLLDKYFVQMDEYGNQLTTLNAKKEVLGKLKAYTGKKNLQIRQMRTDGYSYEHSVTFINTANLNPLMIEEEDRRVALIETPNILRNQDWVKAAGGVSEVVEQLMPEEILDFCYYLAVEVDTMTKDAYMTPPDTADKAKLISANLPAGQRLAFFLNRTMFKEIEELALRHEIPEIFEGWDSGRLYADYLFSLYMGMTDGKGTQRGLSKVLKDAGYDKMPTSKNGVKAFYYSVPALKFYNINPFENHHVESVDLRT